jgi:hypothetical protein
MIAAPWRGCVAVQRIMNNTLTHPTHPRLGCDSEVEHDSNLRLDLSIKDEFLAMREAETRFFILLLAFQHFLDPKRAVRQTKTTWEGNTSKTEDISIVFGTLLFFQYTSNTISQEQHHTCDIGRTKRHEQIKSHKIYIHKYKDFLQPHPHRSKTRKLFANVLSRNPTLHLRLQRSLGIPP